MIFRPLGSTKIDVSVLGFGCWQLGGKGWGTFSLREVVIALQEAFTAGINLFDTAPVYGLGRSEELLGRTVAAHQECVIVSKGGLVWDAAGRIGHDARPESLRTQLTASLRRLRRERVDVYLLHWPDPNVPLSESTAALDDLLSEGLVRAWGLSGHSLSAVRPLLTTGSLPVLELPVNVLDAYSDEFAKLAPDIPPLLAAAAERDVGVLAFDVLSRGLLPRRTTVEPETFGRRDLRRHDWRFGKRGVETLTERRRRLRELALQQALPAAALAIRAVSERRGVTAAVVGMKNPAQLRENLRFVEAELPDELRDWAVADGDGDGTY